MRTQSVPLAPIATNHAFIQRINHSHHILTPEQATTVQSNVLMRACVKFP
jgi:hypothetical protein